MAYTIGDPIEATPRPHPEHECLYNDWEADHLRPPTDLPEDLVRRWRIGGEGVVPLGTLQALGAAQIQVRLCTMIPRFAVGETPSDLQDEINAVRIFREILREKGLTLIASDDEGGAEDDLYVQTVEGRASDVQAAAWRAFGNPPPTWTDRQLNYTSTIQAVVWDQLLDCNGSEGVDFESPIDTPTTPDPDYELPSEVQDEIEAPSSNAGAGVQKVNPALLMLGVIVLAITWIWT